MEPPGDRRRRAIGGPPGVLVPVLVCPPGVVLGGRPEVICRVSVGALLQEEAGDPGREDRADREARGIITIQVTVSQLFLSFLSVFVSRPTYTSHSLSVYISLILSLSFNICLFLSLSINQ